ncbi:MAG: glycoside hydrolase family 27 protein [Elusimicrobiota bacterium]
MKIPLRMGPLSGRLLLFFYGAALAAFAAAPASALDDGQALTPPMGWNSWNKFGCDVNETVIRQAADAMADSGMQRAGYRYVLIDDCWQLSRDAGGNIQADPERFPSGIKALADYVHAKGLRFGLYSDAGDMTCQHRPGSRGYEERDARQYAAWGVDYLKYDWCHTEGVDARTAYKTMSDALRSSGRPVIFSVCEWGQHKPWLWAPELGHLWRTTRDITDCWNCPLKLLGWTNILDRQAGLENYAGPGRWNDPDMLEVGNGGMTTEEYRAHFSMWCMLAAPLIAGNDLTAMDAETRAILTNEEVIAVDQDPLGKQGRRVRSLFGLEVWSKELSGGRRAAALLNRSPWPLRIGTTWKELGLDAPRARVRDLWAKKDLGELPRGYETEVPAHGVVLLLVSP